MFLHADMKRSEWLRHVQACGLRGAGLQAQFTTLLLFDRCVVFAEMDKSIARHAGVNSENLANNCLSKMWEVYVFPASFLSMLFAKLFRFKNRCRPTESARH